MLARGRRRPRRPAARRAARRPARAEPRGGRLLGRAARRAPDVLAAAGAREIAPGAAAELYARTWADASLDVNGIESGDAVQRRTIIPCTASARLSVRLALGQRRRGDRGGARAHPARRRRPPGAEVELDIEPRRAGRLRRGRSGARAGARGDRPRRGQRCRCSCARAARSRSSAALAKRGIPTVLSGFALDADGIHGPDESYRLESLALGERAARELYAALATLS